MAFLGRKFHTAGNKTRYAVDYSLWLDEGVALSAASVLLDSAFTAAVTDVVISDVEITPFHHVVFFLDGGSADETFNVAVRITNRRDEIKNDVLGFTVVAR